MRQPAFLSVTRAFPPRLPITRAATAPVLPAIPHLYFLDPDEGRDREGRTVMPQFVVDVSPYIELKKSMLACHESQRKWLQKHHGMDNYIETMEEWSAIAAGSAASPTARDFGSMDAIPIRDRHDCRNLLGPIVKNIDAA